MMKIAVLVSVGRHPVSGVWRYSRNDAAALAAGLALLPPGDTLSHNAAAMPQLDVWHAGDPSNPALREYLAVGAQRVNVLPIEEGDDATDALSEILKNYDLLLTGTRAEVGMGSGMLPYAVAARMRARVLHDATRVTFEGDEVRVKQFLPKGLRRNVAATLPAVVVVHPLAELTPRFAYARMQRGQIDTAPITAGTSAPDATDSTGQWQWTPARAKPIRLAAGEKRSGHARMVSATTTESRGGSVVNSGSPVEKAQMILAYLREHQLVDY
jgi:electron transfer flavoprotein beta subunit